MGRPAQKRRKLNDSATEEVVFDPAARHEYLTGFHKRKVQRTKAAQEAAAQRARQEKIEERKKLREERKAEIERHVREVNALLPSANIAQDAGSDEDFSEVEDSEWNGLEAQKHEPVDHEDEYIDEDKFTTVTVEEVNINRDGIARLRGSDEDEAESGGSAPSDTASAKPNKPKQPQGKKVNERDKKAKKKKRNFRYESPADRKLNRAKERAKKSKQARLRKDA